MKIAIYGGSFNPPHYGHIVAVSLIKASGFDKVMVVPCFSHPFEKKLTPFKLRYEMCEAAFEHIRGVVISNIDGFIKENWMPKGSKYTLNSEGNLHSFNDLPAVIHPDGYQAWYLNGKPHREDGPAMIHPNGAQSWFLNGERHREDGPALIYSNGNQE